MISILLADHQRMVRKGIKLLINSQSDMNVLWEAENGEDLTELINEKHPDIVILDVNLPKLNSFFAKKQIRKENKKSKLIVLTMHEEKETIFHVLKQGALGYILKSQKEDELFEAIRNVHQGGAYLYPKAIKLLLNDFVKRSQFDHQEEKLTEREQEVLSYIVKGFTNQEVADTLFLSVKTVETHRANIMNKLNMKSRSDLVKYAVQKGFMYIK